LWSYENEDEPAGTASIFPDHFVGRLSASGALATLIGRSRGTVAGGLVEIAQCEAVVGSIADLLAAESVEPGSVRPKGAHTEQAAPGAMYRCAPEIDATGNENGEMWVAINCRDDADWTALCGVIGQPELATDARYATFANRASAAAELDALIGEWTISRNRFDVTDACQEVGVPAGPMLTSPDLLVNDHVKERGFLVEIDQPGVGTFVFEGKTPLNDFYRLMDVDGNQFEQAKGDADTLAGMLLEIWGKFPEKNEALDFNGYNFKIENIENRRIQRIKVTRIQAT
jgi:crotonobetainyl-CoA:carnitine CoA-transferase CaiB-like acyl-CoA transferase